jgi:catechol 2,3-dioxygenase-like lactoylglutathione lyase family enzyme
MLGKADATPMLAVKDLDRARKFYEENLGLKQVDDFGEGFMLKSGDTQFSVYRSNSPGPTRRRHSTSTSKTLRMRSARSRKRESPSNIMISRPDTEGRYLRGRGMRTAWFKDPDGNILSLIEASESEKGRPVLPSGLFLDCLNNP